MARTLRDQIVLYVDPMLSRRTKRIVQHGQQRGERITVSSLGEEMMRAMIDEMEKRYGVPAQAALRKVR